MNAWYWEYEMPSWTAPAEKRGHIMDWAHGLLRLTNKEQTNYPMVRWSEQSRQSEQAPHA